MQPSPKERRLRIPPVHREGLPPSAVVIGDKYEDEIIDNMILAMIFPLSFFDHIILAMISPLSFFTI